MKENNIRKGILIGCGISALLLVGFLGSYAFFISNGTNNPENISAQTGTLSLIFADGSPGITESLEFGSSVEKTFTIENTGTLEGVAKINFEDLVNTYIEGSLTYTLSYSETENGDYSEVVTNENVPGSESSSTQVLADSLVIPAGTKYFYKLTITLNYLEDIDQTADLKAMLSTHFSIEEGAEDINSSEKTLANLNLKIAENNEVNFAEPATTDETADGLYAMEDDYGTSYYFRGAVENNYVKFAGFYWRIIRINGDGSLRMIYDGTRVYANGESNTARSAIGNIEFNAKRNEAKYVGYMYSPKGTALSTSKEEAQTNAVDSTVKVKLDEWYENNLLGRYDEYISDTLFCNDRLTNTTPKVWTNWDTTLGYGKNGTVYRAYFHVPSLKCTQQNDRFTQKDTSIGNGTLKYPVGLITRDEIILAGSGDYHIANKNYFLYKGHDHWSMTPVDVYYSNFSADIAYVNSNGASDANGGSTLKNYAAPVINLKPDYFLKAEGDGTMDNPYILPNETT